MTDTPTPDPTGTVTPNVPDFWPTPAPYEIQGPVPYEIELSFEGLGQDWATNTLSVWQMAEPFIDVAVWLVFVFIIIRGFTNIYREIRAL